MQVSVRHSLRERFGGLRSSPFWMGSPGAGGEARPPAALAEACRQTALRRLRRSAKSVHTPPRSGALLRATLGDGRPADEPGWSAAMSSAEKPLYRAVRCPRIRQAIFQRFFGYLGYI